VWNPITAIQFAGCETKAQTLNSGRQGRFPVDHPFLEHFKFVKANTKVTPKMTIPSPTVLHFRGGRKAISQEVYPDMAGFFEDTGKAYAKAVKAFYDAGCRYLQFDDTVWAICARGGIAAARERGDDPTGLQQNYTK
jgi:5-methyltetrahydropteroyltriglutamate--homocysteine methyltransferase